MDISKYDEAIQKAINNFEQEVNRIKMQKIQKEKNLKETLQSINQNLHTLKNAIKNDA